MKYVARGVRRPQKLVPGAERQHPSTPFVVLAETRTFNRLVPPLFVVCSGQFPRLILVFDPSSFLAAAHSYPVFRLDSHTLQVFASHVAIVHLRTR